jgi:hypothetical protein
MTTKLEIKFTKLSETFINKIKLAEEEYENFLTNFIKTEIIGEDCYEESLKGEIQNVRFGFTQWKPYEVIDSYIKKYDQLETVIQHQIYSLEDDRHIPYLEGGPYELALAKEQII